MKTEIVSLFPSIIGAADSTCHSSEEWQVAGEYGGRCGVIRALDY